MRLRRFPLPIILVLAIVILGGVTAAFVSAKSQPPPAEMISPAESAPVPASLLKEVSGPASKSSSGSGAKSMSSATPGESSPPVSQAEGFTEDAEGEGIGQGTVYTWQDGDRTRRVVLQDAPAIRETVADTTEDGVIKKGELDSIGVTKNGELDSVARKQSQRGSEGQPVFRSESGGELMTLPGGIVLALDPDWDQAAVENFFSRNGIALERTSELDFLDNGFFVETGPGFPSLELANTLVGQDGVILSSPNWSREVELK